MKYPCGYCSERFSTATDRALHQAHTHAVYTPEYYEALQKKYPLKR